MGHRHCSEIPYDTNGPKGKTRLPSLLCHTWRTHILTPPMAPPTWHPIEHSPHHCRSCLCVLLALACSEDGQWTPGLPIFPCLRRFNPMAAPCHLPSEPTHKYKGDIYQPPHIYHSNGRLSSVHGGGLPQEQRTQPGRTFPCTRGRRTYSTLKSTLMTSLS